MSLREKFKELEDWLAIRLPGQSEMARGAVIALLAGQPAVFIGPPGTGKTMMVDLLASAIEGASVFKYLMTKYTTYDEVFGPIDVAKLASGALERRWSRIVEADVVFLDEIFNASSAILNSLLSMLNERRVYDPFTGEARPVKALAIYAASNRVPEEEELRALYDRFAVKVFVDYAPDLASAFKAAWAPPIKPPRISVGEVLRAQEEVRQLLFADVGEGLRLMDAVMLDVAAVVPELRGKGVMISDRTAVAKLPLLAAAYCYLSELPSCAADWYLEVLPYVASSPKDIAAIKQVVAPGVLGELGKLIEEGKELLKQRKFDEALDRFKKAMELNLGDKLNPITARRAEALKRRARELYEATERGIKALSELAEE